MSRNLPLLVIALAACLGPPAAAAELNSLSDLRIVQTGSGTQVVVSGTRAPTFTVFRLSNPDRLVVDLSSADATGIKGHHEGAGPVAGVVASQFTDERASVGRLLLGLDKASQYDVHADGNRVVISVEGAVAAVKASTDRTAEVAVVAAAPEVPDAALSKSAATEPAREPNVVASRVDEQAVSHPARNVTAVQVARDTFNIQTDGQVAKYELIELESPPRLALDLYGLGMAARTPKAKGGSLRAIRVGAHKEKVRFVLDVEGAMPAYQAVRTGNGVRVTFGSAVAAAKPAAIQAAQSKISEATAPGEGPAELEIDGKKIDLSGAEALTARRSEAAPLPVKPEPTVPSRNVASVEVKDLVFEDTPTGGRIELKLTGAARWKTDRPDDKSAVLTLEGARLPKRLERSLDTSALDTPVKMISAFSVAGGTERVRLVVATNGALEESVVKTPAGLSWRLASRGVKTEQVAVNGQTAGFASEPVRYAEQGAPQRQGWVGKKVSFEFKDIEIHNMLRVIAEISKKNIVVADDVQGKLTIRLRNVPWDQALELILRSKSLGKEDLGNVIRVAPLGTLESEAKQREERQKSMRRQEELVVQLIAVNYATVGEMSARVKDVLSERGTVSTDVRTNTLIVRDVASNIARARSLVQTLDTQTPQVLIESRIVEANTSFSKNLGVQWGGTSQFTPANGNPTGLAFPNSFAVTGGSESGNSTGTSATPNFAVNLPAAVGAGAGGALGFIFGSAGGALALNLRLSAMENQGTVKTISAPKVTTIDNSSARISQGVSVPFSQASAAGVSTSFVDARLSLEVTPHITQDGSVLMQIKAENNQPDPSATGSNGQPAIQRKEANTQVLVKDGDTTVIGGIYVRRGSSSVNSVPFFGKIPILGFFFRDSREGENRQELLIFITPRILNRQTVAQNL